MRLDCTSVTIFRSTRRSDDRHGSRRSLFALRPDDAVRRVDASRPPRWCRYQTNDVDDGSTRRRAAVDAISFAPSLPMKSESVPARCCSWRRRRFCERYIKTSIRTATTLRTTLSGAGWPGRSRLVWPQHARHQPISRLASNDRSGWAELRRKRSRQFAQAIFGIAPPVIDGNRQRSVLSAAYTMVDRSERLAKSRGSRIRRECRPRQMREVSPTRQSPVPARRSDLPQRPHPLQIPGP